MKKRFNILAALGMACGAVIGAGPALAAPIVAAGSTYSLFASQSQNSGNSFLVHFDGVTEVFSYDGGIAGRAPMALRVDESQSDLGGGRNALEIVLNFSGGDPFGLSHPAILAIGQTLLAGGLRDALDLLDSVQLTTVGTAAAASRRRRR